MANWVDSLRRENEVLKGRVALWERAWQILRGEVIPEAIENAKGLSSFPGQVDEARAREMAALYLREAMASARLVGIIKALDDSFKQEPDSSD